MSNAHRDDDDDDLGLDESLSSMRSMFREMRDEEPSDKGMAALLAAAREKADEMKPKRSWFAALLEQLRRPPVLAMATVVVLIGGAVVISKTDTKTEVETADHYQTADTSAGDKTVATPPVAEAPSNAVVGGAPGAANERERDLEEQTESAGSVAPPAEPPVVTQRPRPPTKPTTKGSRVEEGSKVQLDGLSFSQNNPADPAPKAEAKKDEAKAPMAIATGDDDGDLSPKGGAAPEATATAPQAPQADQKQVTRKPLPSIEGEDRTAKDSSVAQLLKQCEAAAAKNDCAAVRTIASKIAKQDPQTYKNRVMKNTSIARCLEPPAPLEAAPAPAD